MRERIQFFLTGSGRVCALLLLALVLPLVAAGQESGMQLQVNLGTGQEDENWGVAIQLVVMMTLLTLAPAMIMLMTSFTRIVIVLGFMRNAMGAQQAPSNQLIIGMALILTMFIMGPVWNKVYDDAVVAYQADEITFQEALDVGSGHLKAFMLKQTDDGDLEYFLSLTGAGPTARAQLPFRVVLSAFVISELRTAFQMGFLLFVPFIVVDFLVASVLMSMGMMMMPPVILSMPFKILLFVLVDGWFLVVSSLVNSFNI